MTYAAGALNLIASSALCVLLFSAPEKVAGNKIGTPEKLKELLVPESETLRALRTPRMEKPHRRSAWTRRSNASQLTTPIAGRYARDIGQKMIAAIAALPEERRALGVTGVSTEQLTTGICEPIEIETIELHEGEMYEARYQAEPYVWMTRPENELYTLSSTCTGALLASGGALNQVFASGACTPEDEAAHFPGGSTCRSCLRVAGDFQTCIRGQQCREFMNRELRLDDGKFYDALRADVLACAPDFKAEVMLFVEELGDDNLVPDAFSHVIHQSCEWHYNAGAGALRPYCTSGQGGIELALSDVAIGWTEHIRRPGDRDQPYHRRTFIADEVQADGDLWEATVLQPNTLAEVSVNDVTIGGWGFNPQTLRKDGTDPNVLDQTRAREWIAAMGLKTTTNISGVPIGVYNRNLCEEWQGPDARGRYRCSQPFFSDEAGVLPPDPFEWSYDWGTFFIETTPARIEVINTVTLGATGFMDMTIPGGHIPEILGSPILADPDWENCTWPRMFEPDEMNNRDSEQEVHTVTTQTYRFGKDPNLDLRVVLSTAWRRAFCFEQLPGL